MKAHLLFVTILSWLFGTTSAQAPGPDFQIGFGGNERDTLYKVFSVADGGYMLIGTSDSENSGDKDTELYGMADGWIIRADAEGGIIWQKSFGGDKDDYLADAISFPDGGYLLGGSSLSLPNGNKTAPRIGKVDYWLIRIDSAGNSLWQQSYGGTDNDILSCIISTVDGGYLLGGTSISDSSGLKSENGRGFYDYWIVKVDSLGGLMWEKTIGGGDREVLTNIKEAINGDYLICGFSYSAASGDKSESSSFYNPDWWVIRLDSLGNIKWENSIGGNSYDYLYDAIELDEGDFLLGGASRSDISGDKSAAIIDYHDFWIVQIDSNGVVLNDHVIGANGYDYLKRIIRLTDSTFAFVGESTSGATYDKQTPGYGSWDVWTVFADTSFNVLYDITAGGSVDEYVSNVSNENGKIGIASFSRSDNNGNKIVENQGVLDYWYIEMSTCDTLVYMYLDEDDDGYGGEDSILTTRCIFPAGYSFLSGDCNDLDSLINPGVSELCNGIDDNCSGGIDEDLPLLNCYLDEDGDGYGNVDSLLLSCFIPDGYCANSWDCNDSDSTIHSMVPYWEDLDSDGYGASGSSTLFCSLTPPDGYSSNNDDCDDTNVDVVFQELYYLDNDNDGYGLPGTAVYFCPDPGIGYSQNADDCDDTNSEIYPGALEVENGIDDNCNFAIDEGLVSIPEIENALWNVYPNPAFNYLILGYQGDGYPEATYSIYSQTGEVILRGESFGLTTKIELGKLEEGTWVLEWISKETIHRTIFVVIR